MIFLAYKVTEGSVWQQTHPWRTPTDSHAHENTETPQLWCVLSFGEWMCGLTLRTRALNLEVIRVGKVEKTQEAHIEWGKEHEHANEGGRCKSHVYLSRDLTPGTTSLLTCVISSYAAYLTHISSSQLPHHVCIYFFTQFLKSPTLLRRATNLQTLQA